MKTVYKMPKHSGTAFVRSVLRQINKLVSYTEVNMATYSVVRDTLSYIVTCTEDGVSLGLVLCGDLCDMPVITTSMTIEEYRDIMGDKSLAYIGKITEGHISDPFLVMMLMDRLGHSSFITFEL